MSTAIDTSIVVASLDRDDPHYLACDRLMAGGHLELYVHGLAETFAVLTGGNRRLRLKPADAVAAIEQHVLPHVRLHALSGREFAGVLGECQARGARGGAIYDLLHLAAARKAGADKMVTLDVRDFRALFRKGDPAIEAP